MPGRAVFRRALPQECTAHIAEQYNKGRKLGSGGFGDVWECFHKETGEKLACKVIKKSSLESEEEWGDVAREARVLSQLRGPSCPGVVQLNEALESAGEVYLVMEHCGGGDLFDLLALHGALPEPAARLVFCQLAQALHVCHSRGILHRDIKPENILLDAPALDLYRMTSPSLAGAADDVAVPRVRAKLADFGLCLELKPGEVASGCVGSPQYFSPEVVLGRPYGRRTDVWSMGVVLYLMLSGKHPFSGRTAHDGTGLRAAIVRGEVSFSGAVWKGVSREAKDLIRHMLQRDPSKRITARELLEDPWVVGAPSCSATPAAKQGEAKESVSPPAAAPSLCVPVTQDPNRHNMPFHPWVLGTVSCSAAPSPKESGPCPKAPATSPSTPCAAGGATSGNTPINTWLLDSCHLQSHHRQRIITPAVQPLPTTLPPLVAEGTNPGKTPVLPWVHGARSWLRLQQKAVPALEPLQEFSISPGAEDIHLGTWPLQPHPRVIGFSFHAAVPAEKDGACPRATATAPGVPCG